MAAGTQEALKESPFKFNKFLGTVDAFIIGLGSSVLQNFSFTHRIFKMTYLAFRSLATERAQSFQTILSVVLMQIYFTGWPYLSLQFFL